MTQQGDKHHYVERATSTDHDIDDDDNAGTHHDDYDCLPRRTWTTAERPTPTMTQQGDKHHHIERATSTDHDIDDADDQGTHHYYPDRRRPVTTMTTQEPTTMTTTAYHVERGQRRNGPR
eukprot:Polyplicarium_translucidae@DN2923_c2_g1_i13.p2